MLKPAHILRAFALSLALTGTARAEDPTADTVVATFRGFNTHPGFAKDKMVNAIRAASAFIAKLPRETLSPEATSERQGFLHPYHIEGGVEEVKVRIILRDFETDALEAYAQLLRDTGIADRQKNSAADYDTEAGKIQWGFRCKIVPSDALSTISDA